MRIAFHAAGAVRKYAYPSPALLAPSRLVLLAGLLRLLWPLLLEHLQRAMHSKEGAQRHVRRVQVVGGLDPRELKGRLLGGQDGLAGAADPPSHRGVYLPPQPDGESNID